MSAVPSQTPAEPWDIFPVGVEPVSLSKTWSNPSSWRDRRQVDLDVEISFSESPSSFETFSLNVAPLFMKAFALSSFRDDWDGEGSPGYSADTIGNAIAFIMKTLVKADLKRVTTMPDVLPGPGGTIDIYWKGRSRDLLVNIRGSNASASYFGESSEGAPLRGSFDPRKPCVLIADWIRD